MLKVKDLKDGMKVVNEVGTEFKVVGKKGRKYVMLKRLSDGRVWYYDNYALEGEEVKVIG